METELDILEILGEVKQDGRIKLVCKCKLCGKESIRRRHDVLSGHYASCRCQHPSSCKFGDKSPIWSGIGDLSGHYVARLKGSAKARGYEWNLTKEFLWDLFLKQNKRCALSNLELFMSKSYKTDDTEQTASVGRINQKLGYIEGNVHWVHKLINKMRNKYDLDYFIETCVKISKNFGG